MARLKPINTPRVNGESLAGIRMKIQRDDESIVVLEARYLGYLAERLNCSEV